MMTLAPGIGERHADHVVADLDVAADDGNQFALEKWQEIRRIAACSLMRQHNLQALLGDRGAGVARLEQRAKETPSGPTEQGTEETAPLGLTKRISRCSPRKRATAST